MTPAGPKAYGKAMASPNFSPLWYPTVEALIYPTPNRLLKNIEKRENEEKYFCMVTINTAHTHT